MRTSHPFPALAAHYPQGDGAARGGTAYPPDGNALPNGCGLRLSQTAEEIHADEDAVYDEVYEINLSELEPLIATPHSPGNIKKVSELEGMAVNQVLIGSCTNSSYLDLRKVARILEGKTVAPTVSLGIAPGSREVLEMISQDGSLTTFIKAGARILESACGFCIGNHQSPGTDSVSLRTNNRNFEGRQGYGARTILAGPLVAAEAAVTGRISVPLSFEGAPSIA